jgi:hypothetical protein
MRKEVGWMDSSKLRERKVAALADFGIHVCPSGLEF